MTKWQVTDKRKGYLTKELAIDRGFGKNPRTGKVFIKQKFYSAGTPEEAVSQAKKAGFSIYAKRNVPFGNWGGWVIYGKKLVRR